MSESLVSPFSDGKSTRLDTAHDLMSAPSGEDQMPWMSLAGRDASTTSQQLERQTNELLAYVQRQNDEIDVRQAELNAKLAQLDNELRTARLPAADNGTDLLANESTSDPEPHSEPPLAPVERPAADDSAEPRTPRQLDPSKNRSATYQEFDEVERVVARFSGTTERAQSQAPDREATAQVDASNSAQLTAKSPEIKAPAAVDPRNSVDSFPHLLTKSHLSRVDSGVDIHAMATSLDASELESERRLLAERKNELDRRKAVLQRMQDETQTLHREAMEMRLVTEQLWVQLSEKAPAENINELLGSLRARLDEHYKMQNATIEERKGELTSLKQSIEHKQNDLREQSRKLQDWVESRHDEIKSYAAQIDARELLLDRREHRMQEEFSKWEAQRNSYQQQLQGVLKKLNLSGLGENHS